ncbi:MAG: aminotransferase class I/II-fold pyridoxal phosphate-dependent enzyme [Acidimicrobiales bacterium]
MTAGAGSEVPAVTNTSGDRCGWTAAVLDRCAALAAAGLWRHPRVFEASGPRGLLMDPDLPSQAGEARSVVAFASNDYLGLGSHPTVVRAASDALSRYGAGAGASRLVTGSRQVHRDLENALADWKGAERAVVFPTGFAANVGAIATFADASTLVCSDELNHASIVDGARLARAEVAVYRHGDPEHLEALLKGSSGPTMVISDLVFSMDGDIAPIEAIGALCRRHGSLVLLDEAHAVLTADPMPALEGVEVLRVGTLSKTLGSMGGFVAGPSAFIELIENRARPYIFSTALPPASAAAALAALGLLRSAEGYTLLNRLAGHVERVASGHATPIVPVLLGSEQRALNASAALLDEGIWVPAIRPPTVPEGTSRLRITLSAAHTDDDVGRLVSALGRLDLDA